MEENLKLFTTSVSLLLEFGIYYAFVSALVFVIFCGRLYFQLFKSCLLKKTKDMQFKYFPSIRPLKQREYYLILTQPTSIVKINWFGRNACIYEKENWNQCGPIQKIVSGKLVPICSEFLWCSCIPKKEEETNLIDIHSCRSRTWKKFGEWTCIPSLCKSLKIEFKSQRSFDKYRRNLKLRHTHIQANRPSTNYR